MVKRILLIAVSLFFLLSIAPPTLMADEKKADQVIIFTGEDYDLNSVTSNIQERLNNWLRNNKVKAKQISTSIATAQRTFEHPTYIITITVLH